MKSEAVFEPLPSVSGTTPPTPMIWSRYAGVFGCVLNSFAVASRRTTPFPYAYATASRRSALVPTRPMLIEITFAPLSAAYRIAWAARDGATRNVSEARSGMIFASGATPVGPSEFPCCAPTTPAVPVP